MEILKGSFKFLALVVIIAFVFLMMVLSEPLLVWLKLNSQNVLNWLILGFAISLQFMSWNWLQTIEKPWVSVAGLIVSLGLEITMLIIMSSVWWVVVLVPIIVNLIGCQIAMIITEKTMRKSQAII